MIWLFLILVAMTATLVFFNGSNQKKEVDPLSHYRAQLEEIADDEARGIIDPDSARAAKLEVERRILKIARLGRETHLRQGDKRISVFLAGVTIVAAFLFYIFWGRPDLPAKPGVVISSRSAPIEEGGPTYDQAIATIQDHLRLEPTDLKGWEVLAKSSRAVSDFSTAANAYAELARLDPENTQWRVQQLMSMMAMAGGQITPGARLVLGRLLEEAPAHPAGHYYLGLARLQAGDEAGAKSIWVALADRSAPNAPWMPTLMQQLEKIGSKPPQLSEDNMAAVAAMSPEDRKAFIEGMMERLEERLESEPDDAEGWLMLARSYAAIQNKVAAIDALERGLVHVSGEQAAALRALLDNLISNPDF